MAEYKLTIKFENNIILDDESKETNSFSIGYNETQGMEEQYIVFKESDELSYRFGLSLQYLKYDKAIYRPGHVSFKIQFDDENGSFASTDKTIGSFFKHAVIYLEKRKDSSQEKYDMVAQHYFIFKLSYSWKTQEDGGIFADFDAYSPDKFLTLDRYSKSYTGVKFYEDIIRKSDASSIWPSLLRSAIKDFSGVETDDICLKMNLRNTRYSINRTEADESGSEVTVYYEPEYIQPYLLQYNETPYDFIKRVMNRCGEYFYYESGCLTFGWIEPRLLFSTSNSEDVETYFNKGVTTPDVHLLVDYTTDLKSLSPQEIGSYISVSQDESLVEVSAVEEVYNDYTVTTSEQKITKGEDVYDNFYVRNKVYSQTEEKRYRGIDYANDEYLPSIHPKDDYTEWEEYALYPATFWVNLVHDLLDQTSLADMASFMLMDIAPRIAGPMDDSEYHNDVYGQRFFDENAKYYKERIDGDNIHQFSSNAATPIYDVAFYGGIRERIDTAEKGRLKLELDNSKTLLLGSLISFKGKQYVVVNIAEDCGESNMTIEALPYTSKDTEKIVQQADDTNNKEEVKMTFTDYDLAPPRLDQPTVLKSSGTQRAFVVDVYDPLRLNRVRVLYPWQSQDDEATPWIRMVQPMASRGAGFNFLPALGDEAVINYENGNMEKPYVEGMLYNIDHKPAHTEQLNEQRALTSVNGHSIIFSDGDDGSDVLKGIIPGWDYIGSFLPTMKYDLGEGALKANGGIEMRDVNGLYNLSLSSEKRKISLSSPMGDIEMNAFTGITISAHNGDIRIEGKNVDIVAGNRVNIISGQNREFLPSDKDSGIDFAVEVMANILDHFMPLDMRLLRTVVDSVLKPVGGSLLLKSHYYVCLEADKGKVDLETPVNLAGYVELQKSLMAFFTVLDKLKTAETKIVDDYEDLYNQMIAAYPNDCDDFLDKMHLDAANQQAQPVNPMDTYNAAMQAYNQAVAAAAPTTTTTTTTATTAASGTAASGTAAPAAAAPAATAPQQPVPPTQAEKETYNKQMSCYNAIIRDHVHDAYEKVTEITTGRKDRVKKILQCILSSAAYQRVTSGAAGGNYDLMVEMGKKCLDDSFYNMMEKVDKTYHTQKTAPAAATAAVYDKLKQSESIQFFYGFVQQTTIDNDFMSRVSHIFDPALPVLSGANYADKGTWTTFLDTVIKLDNLQANQNYQQNTMTGFKTKVKEAALDLLSLDSIIDERRYFRQRHPAILVSTREGETKMLGETNGYQTGVTTGQSGLLKIKAKLKELFP